ncbi:MAG: regulatory iron-sulfur-containing complex subunit RicT [Kiritimatiellae bacterium]|nr:regulatory iron-sulfur-containing complex subunit RicT [Kiritimatiellia bacterium]
MNLAHIMTPEHALFYCRVNPGVKVRPGDRYVVDFDYGLDEAEVVEHGDFLRDSKDFRIPGFNIERPLNASDLHKIELNQKLAKQAEAQLREELISAHIRVKIVHTRLSLDGGRIFFRYASKNAVNLTRFADTIQSKFNVDVNIWQVGARDECRLTGCIGCCGRPSCCSSWQKREYPVNLRMAKTQGMPLGPATLNGTCNRLKCCLLHENHVYEEAGANMPENGTRVICPAHDNVKGVIINRDILRGRVVVKTVDGKFLSLAADELSY